MASGTVHHHDAAKSPRALRFFEQPSHLLFQDEEHNQTLKGYVKEGFSGVNLKEVEV